MRLLGRGRRVSARPKVNAPPRDTIRRFVGAEIKLHWAIAGPFLVCYVSALILVLFYNPSPTQPLRLLFSWAHRISGLALAIGPLIVVARNRAQWRLFLYNIKQAWVWTIDDVKWLGRSGAAALGRKVTLPHQGKFNAGEKLNFMMVMTTYPLFILTGILIWLPGVAFYGWLAHVLMALIATPLVVGHIFMATINPDTRKGLKGMVTGFVDREWAEHHYTRWYREHFDGAGNPRGEKRAPSHPPRPSSSQTCPAFPPRVSASAPAPPAPRRKRTATPVT